MLKDERGVRFESSDGSATFTCPDCGDDVQIEGRHHAVEGWESPFDGLLWQVESIPVTCYCGKQFVASWERHVDVTVEVIDEETQEAHTIAEGTY